MRVTRADKTQPLPNRVCDHCRTEILVGQPYKHISPKSGPYGGTTLFRCGNCPNWQVWEYSNSLSAQLARIDYMVRESLAGATDADTVRSSLEDAAAEVREVAEARRESAESIRCGFGHDTAQSEELEDTADQLDSWADDIETVDVPEIELCEEDDDSDEHRELCKECEQAFGQWHSEVVELSMLDECPV